MPQVWCGNQVVDVPVGHPCTLADLLAAFQVPRGYIRFRNDPQGAPLITMPFELLPMDGMATRSPSATTKQEEGGNEEEQGGAGDQEEIAFELVSLASASTSSSAAAIGSNPQDAKGSLSLEEDSDAMGNEMELLEEVVRFQLAGAPQQGGGGAAAAAPSEQVEGEDERRAASLRWYEPQRLGPECIAGRGQYQSFGRQHDRLGRWEQSGPYCGALEAYHYAPPPHSVPSV